MDESRKKKYTYDSDYLPELVSNDTLQCADCKFREAKLYECAIYSNKPDAVVNGTGPCPEYQKA